ncbi:hypothetical protein LGR54_24665 [Ancylobacter sp. Lp-2]|uniref:HK97-gp10 family putative phage morphogenesis protein n=1 Tax=Ancylobacter sp. Lp-2 TaxID=2881339 RepID=UPI001E51AE42|nr:HK97-gp10 family putative phage morphogenesis protein [Ancylobacter sp. Lp-2]MCB4771809.1 hypothetical protein [Ancylobacter sp. Lp-2]
MQTKLDIRGLREVAKGLEQFKKSTQTGVLARALKRAAKPVENAARNYAPVDEGDLKASIGTKVIRRNAGKAAFAEAMHDGATRAEAGQAAREANRAAKGAGASATLRVQASARHAAWNEYGTQKMPAHPFMAPALRANQTVITSSIADDLASEIEKTAKRVAARAAKKGSA